MVPLSTVNDFIYHLDGELNDRYMSTNLTVEKTNMWI